MMKRPAAILFDLDGTLTDRCRSIGVFAERFATHFGTALGVSTASDESELRQVVCDRIVTADRWGHARRADFFRELSENLPWRQRPSPEAVRAFWAAHFSACTRPADQLQDTVSALRALGIRLGVVSNGRGEMQRRKLDVLGIRESFGVVVISGEVGCQKPDPQIFRLATTGLAVTPDECWHVGDHPEHDIAGAHGVGISAVWIDREQPWPASQAGSPHRIQKLIELTALL
jgi:putative hydrolase of the HAD superfamily